jgi:OmpA-OmpF porin, OOP family
MRALGVFACIGVAGCATSSLVLLPDDEGHQGSVAVIEANGRPVDAVIADGNTRTRLGNPRPSSKPLGARGLRKQDRALLTELPPAAKSFLLYFEPGTTTLTPQSVPVLTAVRAEITARSGPEVEVTGHTDTVGAEDFNDRLSLSRANEILDWLTRQGIDRSLMSAVGRGERELKEATADNTSNDANRRVEVIVR